MGTVSVVALDVQPPECRIAHQAPDSHTVAEALHGDDLDRRLEHAAATLGLAGLVIRDMMPTSDGRITVTGEHPRADVPDKDIGYGYAARVTSQNGLSLEDLTTQAVTVATHYSQNLQPRPR